MVKCTAAIFFLTVEGDALFFCNKLLQEESVNANISGCLSCLRLTFEPFFATVRTQASLSSSTLGLLLWVLVISDAVQKK